MKNKIKIWGIITFIVIIGITIVSCDMEDDTTFLIIVNDTDKTRSFYLFIDGEVQKNDKTGEQQATLSSGAKLTYSSNKGFTYNVNQLYTGAGLHAYFRGSVETGETLELKFSERPSNFP